MEFLVGDSEAARDAKGSGGDDLSDLGPDGGFAAVGDHNIIDPAGGSATGAGNDRVIGGSADEVLIGDSAVVDATVTSAGRDLIEGHGGNDTLFGDNTNFDATETAGTAGAKDRLKGGYGDDTLRAGPGDDHLDGGPQTDDCDGEAGDGDTALRCEMVNGIP
ncbi:hypothetical protein J7E97_19045 [Streptomyces sp. ISL-66]|uniref:calcium-binding protein n=1 Tax=Streptomyces sp. ISL-66 TaxID=2819186 RepID=UPI001BED1830|nr:hypothetical protein [Streptomyces sp. ISL-66]MBT2469917.1 hypothetical protein [Streptomyces sp. ISL-66]